MTSLYSHKKNLGQPKKRGDKMAKRKILVPESRVAMDQLKAKVSGTRDPDEAKYEIAKEQGIPLQKGYNGKLTSEQAGKVGGAIGGNMVKELVKMAQANLSKK
jgi:small acid-soluble spore protein D (minor alpha/beta-type SASP)